MKKALWLFIVPLAMAGCSMGNGKVLSVTGQIEGVGVDAGSRVGGRVAEVLAEEGDRVKAGDVLIKLEASEAEALVAAAAAHLAQTEALYAKLAAGARVEEIRQAEAAAQRTEEQYRLAQKGFRTQEVGAGRSTSDAARAQRDEAEANFRRIEQLYRGNAASQQVYDQAKHALEAAEAQYQATRSKLDILVKGSREEEIGMAKAARDQAVAALELLRNGARVEDLEAARAAHDAAKADLDRAQAAAREMTVLSPRDGVVESIDVHAGDLVKPGAIVRVVDPEDLELRVYVSAQVLGLLRLGQKVRLTTDSHGAETFEGVVSQIATQGEYTPRNLQTKEERVQQVFGVKIKLDSAGGKLRAGMTATAHLDLRNGAEAK